MSSQQNKAVVRSNFEVTWNRGDPANIQRTHHPQAELHGLGPDIEGPDALEQMVVAYRSAFPDLEFTVEDQFGEDDKVMTRWTVTGTHTGDFMGIPPTDKSARITGVSVTRFADGKIAESWDHWDALGMLQQLGVVPML